MTRRNLFAAVIAVGVLTAVGCGPAKQIVDRTFALSTETPAKTVELPAQGAAQTVKVEVNADNFVDVYVLLNAPGDVVNMDEKDLKAKAAASKTGTKGETLSVQVPAGQAVTVWVGRSGTTQKATGTVKLTN